MNVTSQKVQQRAAAHRKAFMWTYGISIFSEIIRPVRLAKQSAIFPHFWVTAKVQLIEKLRNDFGCRRHNVWNRDSRVDRHIHSRVNFYRPEAIA